jgi:cell division protein FtsB
MRWFIAVLAVLVLVLQYRIWIARDGAREVLSLRESVKAQQMENQRLQQRNRQLAAEVRDLKQGFGALEERARSELGLVSRNETYYQVVPPERDHPATLPPAASGNTALRTAAR